MGNCSLKSVAGEFPGNSIRVLTETGKIVEFKGPSLVGEIVSGYSGYGIFRRGQATSPLPENECLINGFYYLLPLGKKLGDIEAEKGNQIEPPKVSSAEFVENLATGSAMEVLPTQKDGVWRVKLVINTKQLEEILSEQVNTEALIEKMRTAAAATTAGMTPRRSRSSWMVGWKKPAFSVKNIPTPAQPSLDLG